jgi:hypothetical protein
MTDEKFCAQFDRRFFPNWERYGMLLTSQIAPVARELGLPREFLSFRRYAAIVYRFNDGQRAIFVFSEIDLREGYDGFNDHCSLLREIDDRRFKLWTPWDDGSESERDFEADVWDAKACVGVVLQP